MSSRFDTILWRNKRIDRRLTDVIRQHNVTLSLCIMHSIAQAKSVIDSSVMPHSPLTHAYMYMSRCIVRLRTLSHTDKAYDKT